MADRVLVTGATGFLGGHLVRALVDLGYEVAAMVRPGHPPAERERLRCRVVEGDLAAPEGLREAVDGCRLVFHCAALVSFHRRDAALMERVNVEGTRYMVAAARDAGVDRFVLTSSVSGVGYDPSGRVLDEKAPFNFGRLRVPYCETKHRAEQVALAEGAARGLDVVIVNPSFVFGAGDRRKARGGLLERVARRPPLLAPPGGMNVVDVHDVVSGHLLAAHKGRAGERYILGGENLTHRDLLRRICRIIGKRPPRMTLPYPAAAAGAWLLGAVDRVAPLPGPLTPQIARLANLTLFYTSRKATDELGYAPYPIDMAIKSAYDWMLDTDLLPPGLIRATGRY